MDWLTLLWARLRALFLRKRLDADLDEELHLHIELETEKNVRAGMAPREARRRALVAFGGVERYREQTRDARGLRLVDDLRRDVSYALRTLARTPGTSLLIVLTLALAIGAGTTTYSVVSGVVLRSLPFRDPGRLVSVRVLPVRVEDPAYGSTLSPAAVRALRAPSGTFEASTALRGVEPVLTGLGEPERIHAAWVAPSFFSVLGTPPLLGRVIDDADIRASAQVVVVSHRFWVTHLGRDRDAVGRTLNLDGQPYEVVGVTPPGFSLPDGTRLWLPAPESPGEALTGGGTTGQVQGRYWLVGRLAPGVTLAQARGRLTARLKQSWPEWKAAPQSLTDRIEGTVREPLLLLLGAVVLVLLVACANVAAVLLARGVARRHELAIRLSLGAGRRRLLRQLITESLLLSLASGAFGVALAYRAVPAVVALAGDQLPRITEIDVDARVLVASLVAAVLTGLLAGTLPAVMGVREDPSSALKDGGMSAGLSRRRRRLGDALVLTQVALSTILLTGGALLAVSFVKLMRVDLGFDPGHVVTASLRLPGRTYGDSSANVFVTQLLERARALPGVRSAAVSAGAPFQGYAYGTVEVPDEHDGASQSFAYFNHVTSDFFSVYGLRLLRGRAFPETGHAEPGTILVNEAFARAVFPGLDPIGRTVVYYGDVRGRIIGVVSDSRMALMRAAPLQLYAPEVDEYDLTLSVRTAADVSGITAGLRHVIHAVDPLVPIDRAGPLNDVIVQTVAAQRLYAIVLSAFSLIALLIASLGMYGLTAYTTRSRTREIGMRMALGATRAHVRAVTVGRTGALAAAGLAVGLAGAAAATRLLKAMLFHLTPTDPAVFAGVAAVLVAVAILAAVAPAERAARVDPMKVLRSE